MSEACLYVCFEFPYPSKLSSKVTMDVGRTCLPTSPGGANPDATDELMKEGTR